MALNFQFSNVTATFNDNNFFIYCLKRFSKNCQNWVFPEEAYFAEGIYPAPFQIIFPSWVPPLLKNL